MFQVIFKCPHFIADVYSFLCLLKRKVILMEITYEACVNIYFFFLLLTHFFQMFIKKLVLQEIAKIRFKNSLIFFVLDLLLKKCFKKVS